MLRFIVFGVMGLLLAGLGTVAYVSLQPPPEIAAAPRKQVTILVAAGALRAGSLLQPADLAAHVVDATAEPAGSHADTPEERRSLIGGMVRRTLGEADPILADDVLRPGDRGFLAAVLAPGTRAISVAVDAVSGTAGLIWPGDRVDVILTQTLDAPDQGLGHRVAGETVLADARVIAVDQQLVQGGQAGGLLDQHGPASSRTITLEVEPRDAARVTVATRLGKLQVVLRAAQPGLPGPTNSLVAQQPVDGPGIDRTDATPRPITTDTGARLPVRSARLAAPHPVPPRALAPVGAPVAPPGGNQQVTAEAAPVWGGDVSRALNDGSYPQRNVEVRLFQGGRKVEAYRF